MFKFKNFKEKILKLKKNRNKNSKDKIQQLFDKNSQKRLKKQKKDQLKKEFVNKKNQQKIKRHKLYAQKHLSRRNNFINKRITNIKRKYDRKIAALKNKLFLLLKNPKQEEREKIKFENSLINKYYKFQIKRIKKVYENKINKVKHNNKIAKIDNQEVTEILNNIEIDRHLNLEFYVKKINVLKNNCTTIQQIKNRINYFKKQKTQEIDVLTERKKHVPAINLMLEIKDIWENIKALFIMGTQIKTTLNSVSSNLRRYSMFYILIFIVTIFYFTTDGRNIKPNQFINIIQSNTYILIIGMAMLMVIVSGYIDLSVGALMGFLGAFSVLMFNRIGNLFFAIILTLLIGVLVGIVQGVLIGYFKMPSFIVTLGGMLLFKGLIIWLTESETLIPNSDSYQKFTLGKMPDIKIDELNLFSFLIILFFGIMAIIIMIISRRQKIKYGIKNDNPITFMMKLVFIMLIFSAIAYSVGYSLFGLEYYIIYIIIFAIIFMFIMQNTSFGRKIYAIGGNHKAATLSGINRARITTFVFIIIGIMTGFASIIFTGINTSASPAVSGSGYELDIISSVFVGGASMTGGIGTVQGTLIGGLILGYINNGMNLMNLGSDMQDIIKAVVLVSAVGYDIFSNRKIG